MEIITSPSATGGTGPDFEFKVGAACLTLLLTGGAPFFLETGTVNAVHFQTKYLGWQTDDLLLEAVDGQGEKHKAAIQVKRSFVLSEKDKESTEALRRAFADFRNASLFNQGRDMVGLITSSLSAKLVRGLRTLLDCARASTGSADMIRRLQIPGYLGKPTHDYYNNIVAILRGSSGEQPTDEEIWRFLCRFNVVDCDLNFEHGFIETMMRSLLAVTARDNNSAAADTTWNTLCTLAATRTGTASSYTLEKLPEPLLQRHNHASGYPAGALRLLEDSRFLSCIQATRRFPDTNVNKLPLAAPVRNLSKQAARAGNLVLFASLKLADRTANRENTHRDSRPPTISSDFGQGPLSLAHSRVCPSVRAFDGL